MVLAKTVLRLQFKLRTLLVVISLLGVWLGSQANWIRSRREWLAEGNYVMVSSASAIRPSRRTAYIISLLHEESISQILLRNAADKELSRVQWLFPEANVVSGNWLAPDVSGASRIGKDVVGTP